MKPPHVLTSFPTPDSIKVFNVFATLEKENGASISWMKKQVRDLKCFAWDHTARKQQHEDLNSDLCLQTQALPPPRHGILLLKEQVLLRFATRLPAVGCRQCDVPRVTTR